MGLNLSNTHSPRMGKLWLGDHIKFFWTERNYVNSQSVIRKIALLLPWIQCFQSSYRSMHILLEHVTGKYIECWIIKVEFRCHYWCSWWSAKFSPDTKYDSCITKVNICKLMLLVTRSLDLFNWNFHFLNFGWFNKKMRLSQELTVVIFLVHNQLCPQCLRHTIHFFLKCIFTAILEKIWSKLVCKNVSVLWFCKRGWCVLWTFSFRYCVTNGCEWSLFLCCCHCYTLHWCVCVAKEQQQPHDLVFLVGNISENIVRTRSVTAVLTSGVNKVVWHTGAHRFPLALQALSPLIIIKMALNTCFIHVLNTYLDK